MRCKHASHTHTTYLRPHKPTTQKAHRALFAGIRFFLAGRVWLTITPKAATTHGNLMSVRARENALVHFPKGNANHLEASPEFGRSVILLLVFAPAVESDVAVAHWHGIFAPLAARGVCAHIRSWRHDLW